MNSESKSAPAGFKTTDHKGRTMDYSIETSAPADVQRDELYKLLVAGKATPDDQKWAADWIARLRLSAPAGDEAGKLADELRAIADNYGGHPKDRLRKFADRIAALRSQPPQPTGDSWQPMETAPKGIPTENVGCRGASEWFVGRSSPDGNPIIRRRAWPHEDSWEDRNGTTYRPRYFDGWCPLAPTAQPTGDVGGRAARASNTVKTVVEALRAAAFAEKLVGLSVSNEDQEKSHLDREAKINTALYEAKTTLGFDIEAITSALITAHSRLQGAAKICDKIADDQAFKAKVASSPFVKDACSHRQEGAGLCAEAIRAALSPEPAQQETGRE